MSPSPSRGSTTRPGSYQVCLQRLALSEWRTMRPQSLSGNSSRPPLASFTCRKVYQCIIKRDVKIMTTTFMKCSKHLHIAFHKKVFDAAGTTCSLRSSMVVSSPTKRSHLMMADSKLTCQEGWRSCLRPKFIIHMLSCGCCFGG
jgi:hypothetical protein